MWEDLIQKAKDGGLDVVETYVFWNVHEPSPGNVLFTYSFHFTFKVFYFVLLCLPFSSFSNHACCCVCAGFQYNFEGRYDLVRFLKTIQKAGLYAHLRIGPYVCAEWNFGYSLSLFLLLDLTIFALVLHLRIFTFFFFFFDTNFLTFLTL